MEKQKREIRTLACDLHVREAGNADGAQEESRLIEGTAIVFNRESEVLDEWGYRFREIILPEAATQKFLDSQDIKMNMLHDRSLTIARANRGDGSMKLWVDKRGVHFEFEAPKCDIGDRCLELVRRGDYSGCSFEFYPDDYEVEEVHEGDETDVRITHRKFKALTALTIGMDPAYTATSVNARELYDQTPTGKAEREAKETAEREAKEKAEREAKEKAEREAREKQERVDREMERRVEQLRRLNATTRKLEQNF